MPSKKLLIPVVLVGLYVSLGTVAAQNKAPAAAPTESKPVHSSLTAAQIVDKHVAARGGLAAWRAVQTLSLSGKMDAGSGSADASRALAIARRGHTGSAPIAKAQEPAAAEKQVQLPFVYEMKRPRKSRVEIEFAGKTAVQVYDGTQGWKKRPFLNRDDFEPFTAEEIKSEGSKAELDGPLVDYAAKGTKVELAAIEPVGGHDAYKLKLTTKDGTVQHVWIDTGSFLDVKVEGAPRRMDGHMHNVYIYPRDYRSVQGVMIPFVLETAVDGYPGTHKMLVEKATVNPKLDDARFVKPT
jgi:hypothetical protein